MLTLRPEPRATLDAWRAGDVLVLSLSLNARPVLAALSDAEREVVDGVLAGLSNAAIAKRRGTSERTVGNQLHSASRKLGVSGRSGLVALAGGR